MSLKDYPFVELWRKEGGANWHRMHLGRVLTWLEGAGGRIDLYGPVQSFASPLRSEHEIHWQSFFLDLDSETDLKKAWDEALRALNFFQDQGVNEKDYCLSFSGKKGFHLSLNASLFGFAPSSNLFQEIGMLARVICDELSLETADRGLYNSRRLLRVVGSVHGDTYRRAVRLKGTETLDEILERSTHDAPLEPFANLFPDDAEPILSQWRGLAESLAQAVSNTNKKASLSKMAKDGNPVCVEDILRNGFREKGRRNRATLALSTWYKLAGKDRNETEDILSSWVEGLPDHLTSASTRERIQGVKSVVRSTYAKDGAYFSCAFIRSLGSGTSQPIACQHATCPYIRGTEETEGGPLSLSLSQAVRHENVGKSFVLEGYIGRKDLAPRIIPIAVKVDCKPGKSKACQVCIVAKTPDLEAVATPDQILELCETKVSLQVPFWSRAIGIPKLCPGHEIVPTRRENVILAKVQPDFDTIVLGDVREDPRENDVYVLAHDVELQQRYRFDATTLAHPKDSHAIHLATTFEKLASPIDQFEMTPEFYKLMSLHQPVSIDPIDHLLSMHASYEGAIHPIQGRRYQALAIALIWHSVIQFQYEGKPVSRGWLQALAYGDTGQGKSELTEAFRRFYNLGSKISGENVSLAGLTSAAVQTGSTWTPRLGELPRRDRELVMIEEWHGAPEEVIKSMSEVFDSGLVKMTKVTDIKALARCRKILIANCINSFGASIHMAARTYGVEHVPFIMRTPEDVRRLDIVIPFASNEEVSRQINTKRELHPLDSDLGAAAELIVRWCWSRKSHHIKLLEEAEDYAKESADVLSRKYSDDIPLLSPGDTRLKLLRLAVAVAGQCFSTDRFGEILVVHAGHVHAARVILETLYDSEDAEFNLYSDMRGSRAVPTSDDLKIIHDRLAMNGYDFRFEAFEVLRDTPSTFSVNQICDMVGADKDDVKEFLQILRRYHLIERSGATTRMTSRGVFAIKKWLQDINRVEAGEAPLFMNMEPENWRIIKGRQNGNGHVKDHEEPL